MSQAKLSAPSPQRSTTPVETSPSDQLMMTRLAKNAANAQPQAQHVEAEEDVGQERHRHHRHQQLDEADRDQRGDQLGWAATGSS